MKVLVTGPDGILGSNLIRELIKRNYDVSIFRFPSSESMTLQGLLIRVYEGDILKFKEIEKAVQGHDIIIHCAANTSVWPARDVGITQVNICGTENVIKACLKHKVKRLITIGTANSFSYGSRECPGTENTPYSSGKYGLDYMDSKRKAQELVLDAVVKQALPALIVNPTFMLGSYDSKPSSGQMILSIYKGKVPGYSRGGKNFIAVKDVAVGTANAITMGRIGECYIMGNENLTFKEAFTKIADTIHVSAPRLSFSDAMTQTYGSINSFFARILRYNPSVTKELALISCDEHYYSSEKAIKELDLPQTPIEVAIKEGFEWFKENGYLSERHH